MRRLRESSLSTYGLQFSHVLSPELLQGLSLSKKFRHYCNVFVFWAWLAMILEANASLSKGVNLVQAWSADAGLPQPSAYTRDLAPLLSMLFRSYNSPASNTGSR